MRLCLSLVARWTGAGPGVGPAFQLERERQLHCRKDSSTQSPPLLQIELVRLQHSQQGSHLFDGLRRLHRHRALLHHNLAAA